MKSLVPNSISRREAVRTTLMGSAALATGALPLHGEDGAHRRPGTPDEAVERLMAGNRRFAAGTAEAPRRSLDRVRLLNEGQSPYAAILGCADSRVPVEIIFDEGLGDLFTVRVAGNVATPEEMASLEYAVGVLGSEVVLVLGHSSCGAVTAAVEGKPVPGQISTLFQHIAPNVPRGASIDAAVEANVRHQADVLRRSSTVIAEAVANGTVQVRGAVYSLEDGTVRLLD